MVQISSANISLLFRLFIVGLIIALAIFFLGSLPMQGEQKTEILWDTWGVPHIYAANNNTLFKAFGMAQTKSHGNLLLQLYGQSRGKAAQYWGEKYLPSDEYVLKMGIPKRAEQWYSLQSQEMRGYLDAFASGINQYAQENSQELEEKLKVVLPITGVDILAHLQRVIHFDFLVNPQQIASGGEVTKTINKGSNAWAIAPTHSASGKAMLLANPHLPWSNFYLWYEAQLVAPGLNIYGATLVGMPTCAIAFNNNLGWTFTVNPIDGYDIYELQLKDGGYLVDGEIKAFEEEKQTLKIGKFVTQELNIKKSIFGTIIEENKDKALALKVVGLDRPSILEQLWEMGQSKNLSQFEESLNKLQLPMFNILYADREGEIFYVYNGLIPKKSEISWQRNKTVAGNTLKNLAKEYHSYEELPKIKNPANGWVQNSNDPPWTSTEPAILKASDYPPYFAPQSLGETKNNILRPQRSIALLKEDKKITFEQMIEKKFSSRLELADRVLDDLINAAKLLANPLGLEAASVLEAWDRQTNAESRGAVLFSLWALSMSNNGIFAQPWQAESPLTTPTGLGDYNLGLGVLEGVAAQVKLLYGSLDVSWGEVVRLRYGGKDFPASGGPGKLGSFRVMDLMQTQDERFQVVAGDTYIAAIEFSNPIKAKVLTVYGNATQKGSPHVGDQLELYSRSQLRDAWLTRSEVEAHLESRTMINN